ncbi:hypothetical protein ABH935_009175 [Catenulispora sp. GAS73]|uniref:hypothetical protein n=1 Tax=Catenulispora sp. GAS73 TaxID=3156269 RepID=UPI00351214A2
MDLLQTVEATSHDETEVATLEMSDVDAELEQLRIPPTQPGIRIKSEVGVNNGSLTLLSVVVAEARKRSKLPSDFLAEVRRTFAQPGKTFDSAFSALRSNQRLVVLRYRPDSGTRTAAVAMIARLTRNEHVRPHYLRVGGPNGLPTAELASEKYQAYLMDLTVLGEETDLSPDFGVELKAVSAILRKSDSYLIVITEDEQWGWIGQYAPDSLVHDLEPPNPVLVAQKWLKERVPDRDFADWFTDPAIRRLLNKVAPREAVKIAQLIETAVAPGFKPLLDGTDLKPGTTSEDADFQQRVRSVVASRAQWRSDLLDWHKAPGRTAFERNFLLATAVLSGFSVGVAYAEAKRLCKVFRDVVAGVSGHSGPGVIELLDTIRADTDHDESVVFPRPRWAEAVLAYYWQDRPDDHDAFITWLAGLPKSESIRPATRAAVATRVSDVLFDLIMTPERVGQLGRVIDLWSAQEESRTAARSFLTAAALHPTLGRDVARMMLDWSKQLGVQRRIAVAVVCGGDFGQLSTDKALVRLSYLIESDEPEVVTAAEQAVVALWKQPETGRELLEQLIKWESDGVATHVRAARNIFTRVAALPSPTAAGRPDLLVRAVASEEDLDLVAKGWRCLLESEMKGDALGKALLPWFDAALVAPDVAADVMSVFERVTADSRRAHRRLENCAYFWRGSSGPADETPAGIFMSQVVRLGERESNGTAPDGPGEEDPAE